MQIKRGEFLKAIRSNKLTSNFTVTPKSGENVNTTPIRGLSKSRRKYPLAAVLQPRLDGETTIAGLEQATFDAEASSYLLRRLERKVNIVARDFGLGPVGKEKLVSFIKKNFPRTLNVTVQLTPWNKPQ